MENPLLKMIEKRRNGIHSGVPSFCSANRIVIEAVLDQAKRFDDFVVIEATSNQVNQFGGYINMTPIEFKEYVYKIADKINFDKEKIILGGDHLGPQPWQDLNEKEAMENAKELVRECVLAGYIKIHLDTSMRVLDDDRSVRLSDEIIARRGAELLEVAENAYQELLKKDENAVHPVFVIGSEVPIPGGTQNDTEELKITTPSDFEQTLITYRKEFKKRGLDPLWKYVIAVVVQPGVEFGDSEIVTYDRLKAHKLCQKLKEYPDMVFEGHSTDYQSPEKLREMVQDGIAIIKVGPALTLAVREAIFALSMIENELILDKDKRSNFIDVLENVMTENPKNWNKYYHGNELELHLSRKYSFSDRCRYYFSDKRVEDAINKLFKNLNETKIPLNMLHQYMPNQYVKVRDGIINPTPEELTKANVVSVVEDYNYAVKHNYMISSIFLK